MHVISQGVRDCVFCLVCVSPKLKHCVLAPLIFCLGLRRECRHVIQISWGDHKQSETVVYVRNPGQEIKSTKMMTGSNLTP